MRLALFQPDIPQNTGTILRLTACLGVETHIIGPAGFDMTDRALRRAGLDYLSEADLTRHASWDVFLQHHRGIASSRLLLLTTQASTAYTTFAFQPGDCLLLGRESAGAPEYVHLAADHRLAIPIKQSLRSLNIAVSAAMVLGEALRQTASFPAGA